MYNLISKCYLGNYQMNNRKKMNKARRTQKYIIVLPCIITAILLLQIIFNFIIGVISVRNGQNQSYNSSSGLMLSIIGIAVTVWVGLNLYNVYSRQELQELLEQAERASSIICKVYTETLISKFRLSSKDGTARFYAEALSSIDPLPERILEQMIDVEDIYLLAYEHYRQATKSDYYKDGILRVNSLLNFIQNDKNDIKLTKTQAQFLQGYLSLRMADLTHFMLQYPPTQDVATDLNLYKKCIKGYRDGVYILFGIRDVPSLRKIDVNRYSAADQACISFVYNSIGALQLHYRTITESRTITIDKLSPIDALNIALAFSDLLPPIQLAIFERNLGVAYEHNDQMELAFNHYAKSYELDKKNGKTAHCIGSWYYKQIMRYHPEVVNALESGKIPKVDKKVLSEVHSYLRKSCYWYDVEKATNCGVQDKNAPRMLILLSHLDNSSENTCAVNSAMREKQFYDEVHLAAQKNVKRLMDAPFNKLTTTRAKHSHFHRKRTKQGHCSINEKVSK